MILKQKVPVKCCRNLNIIPLFVSQWTHFLLWSAYRFLILAFFKTILSFFLFIFTLEDYDFWIQQYSFKQQKFYFYTTPGIAIYFYHFVQSFYVFLVLKEFLYTYFRLLVSNWRCLKISPRKWERPKKSTMLWCVWTRNYTIYQRWVIFFFICIK